MPQPHVSRRGVETGRELNLLLRHPPSTPESTQTPTARSGLAYARPGSNFRIIEPPRSARRPMETRPPTLPSVYFSKMVIHPRNRLVIAIATAAAFFTVDAALGQRSYYGQDSGHSSKVRVPDDPAREPREVAQTDLSGGDVDRALSVYQDILDKLLDRVAPTYLAPRSKGAPDHVAAGYTV